VLEFDVLFNCCGKEVIINATKNMMFAELASKFMDKFGIITDDQPKFIYKNISIPTDCCLSLGELKIRMSSIIYVPLYRDTYNIPKISIVILFF